MRQSNFSFKTIFIALSALFITLTNNQPLFAQESERISNISSIILAQSQPLDQITKSVRVNKPDPASLVDLNSADAQALAVLPGFNAELAAALVKYREEKGNFSNLKQLLEIPGITQEIISGLRGFAFIKGAQGPQDGQRGQRPNQEGKGEKVTGQRPSPDGQGKVTSKEGKKGESTKTGTAKTAPALEPGTKININTADSKELQKLPMIGPSLAEKIIEYRKENGPFANIDDIKKVSGIGKGIFDRIKDFIGI